jgi:hypothetical protein
MQDDMFLRNVGLSPNFMVLQPIRLYYSMDKVIHEHLNRYLDIL